MLLVDELATRLVALGVATLHEANHRQNLVTGIQLLVGGPFAGPAVTVALPSGDNLGVHLALAAAEPGSVVCVASAGRGLYGVVGELLIEAACARGIVGFVLDDGLRDLDELRPPPSIAACGLTSLGTVKRRLRQAVGSDISVGGTLVSARDWVVCDHDGIAVIAAAAVADVLVRADERVARESGIRTRLRELESSLDIFDLPTHPKTSIS
jgi:4-hydroxy-4-methyl-2-oxoglutarate aldolase